MYVHVNTCSSDGLPPIYVHVWIVANTHTYLVLCIFSWKLTYHIWTFCDYTNFWFWVLIIEMNTLENTGTQVSAIVRTCMMTSLRVRTWEIMTTCNVLGGGWGHVIACKKKINIQQQYLKDYACILMQPSPVKLVEKGAEVQEHNQLVEHRLV